MKQNIKHNKPSLGREEMDAVTRVITRGHLIAGEEVKRLEEGMRTYTQARFAIAVSSGHAALHLSLLALGIEKNDEVILPSYTVSDVLNTILYIRGVPIVVDIEENGFGLDAAKVQEKITPRTKAIIVPHMLGMPAQVDVLQQYGIPIIEDSAQALGCQYKNKPLGSFSDLSIFSFYATKMITTGQGGMIITNKKKYYDLLQDLLAYNAPKKYRVRYNYELTDLGASIGNVQLKKLPFFIKRRKEIAQKYMQALKQKNVLFYPDTQETNYFRYVLEFSHAEKRNTVQQSLERRGIATIIPLKPYEAIHTILQLNKNDFPNTEKKTNTTLSLPLYPALTDKEVDTIVKALEEIIP